MASDGVHANHCCVVHGCKYLDPDCPVYNRRIEGVVSCESCTDYNFKVIKYIVVWIETKYFECGDIIKESFHQILDNQILAFNFAEKLIENNIDSKFKINEIVSISEYQSLELFQDFMSRKPK